MNRYFPHLIILVCLFVQVPYAACTFNNPGGEGWMDSYSVNGKCYCETSFDHNVGALLVDTPAGKKTVKEVCEKIGLGAPKRRKGIDPIYNTVQCGYPPPNGFWDEVADCCPGRVDLGKDSCLAKGPKWDLSGFGSTALKPPGGLGQSSEQSFSIQEWNKNILLFNLPESGPASISVYHIEGRNLIHSLQIKGNSGLNQVSLSLEESGKTPYLIKLEFKGNKISKSFLPIP